jgi:hypothetical protein
VRLAEFIDAPDGVPDRPKQVWIGLFCRPLGWREQDPESLFGQREENVVIAGEVAIDGRGAVLDSLGNLAN